MSAQQEEGIVFATAASVGQASPQSIAARMPLPRVVYRRTHTVKRDRLLIVASLSIGTALLVCMLSSTYAVLIDPLPFPEANRVVTVSTIQSGSRFNSSLSDYDDLSESGGPLQHSVYVTSVFGGDVEIGGHPENFNGFNFEGDLMSVFGKAPVLGTPSDLDSNRERDTPAAILSYPAWVKFFGKDPHVLGKAVRIGPRVCAVRAVLPPEYQLALPADIWITAQRRNAGNRGNRDGRIFARLAPNVSVAAANVYLATMASSLQKEAPETNQGVTFETRLLRDSLVGESKTLLYLLAFGAAIVLCVAYFNVYQLLAAKAVAASAQWSIRLALGASRRRLFQDMLKEPMLLTLAGCTLGLLLSIAGVHALRTLAPAEIPRIADTRLVWQIAAASFVLSTVAAVLFTLLMFMRVLSLETDILSALRGGQRGTSIRYAFKGNRQFVLIAQIALSATLLISMAMAALALRKATDSPLGFNADGVSVTDLALKEPTNSAAGGQYVRDVIQRVSMLPGVGKVALASGAPFEDTSYTATFTTNEAGPGGGKDLRYVPVSPEFFHTLQTTVLRGRTFADSDDNSSPKVAILNRAAAQALFGAGQGLMQQLKGDLGRGESAMRVVGVVENIRQDPTTIVPPPIVYLPLAQAEARFVSLMVRANSTVGNAEIKSQIWALNANQAVPTTTRLVDLIDASLRRIRYMAFLMALFATATMLLSALGIYAAVAHWLSTSQKEIAVCIALGASYSGIRGSILARIMAVTGVAFAIGSIAALAASNSIRAFLYGVQPQFGAAFVWAASLLGATALLSSYVPAVRSRFVDPAELLRGE